MYEYVLVIIITRNTTISYLGRRQRTRNKLDTWLCVDHRFL